MEAWRHPSSHLSLPREPFHKLSELCAVVEKMLHLVVQTPSGLVLVPIDREPDTPRAFRGRARMLRRKEVGVHVAGVVVEM